VTLLLKDVYKNEGMMTLHVAEHVTGTNLFSEGRRVDQADFIAGMKNALFPTPEQGGVVNQSSIPGSILHVDIHAGGQIGSL
jgi:hypothetical protein